MAIKSVTFTATCEGKPLEVLQELVRKRSAALRETSRDSVVATAINILTSLKSATRKAPTGKAPRQSYYIELTNLYGGFYTDGGLRKICARIGSHTGKKSDISPAIGFGNKNGDAVLRTRVYKVMAQNPRMTFARNKNFPNRAWYVLAENEAQARSYAERRILRMLRKESGMAKYTIAIAQAKVSTRNSGVVRPSGARSWRIAHGASNVVISKSGFDSGNFGIYFRDDLDYSVAALKGGKAAFDMACMKAANKTAGLIHLAFVNKKFSEDVQTPFPEVKGRR